MLDVAFSLQSILSPLINAISLSAVVSPNANCVPVVSTTNFPVIVSGVAIVNLLDKKYLFVHLNNHLMLKVVRRHILVYKNQFCPYLIS